MNWITKILTKEIPPEDKLFEIALQNNLRLQNQHARSVKHRENFNKAHPGYAKAKNQEHHAKRKAQLARAEYPDELEYAKISPEIRKAKLQEILIK